MRITRWLGGVATVSALMGCGFSESTSVSLDDVPVAPGLRVVESLEVESPVGYKRMRYGLVVGQRGTSAAEARDRVVGHLVGEGWTCGRWSHGTPRGEVYPAGHVYVRAPDGFAGGFVVTARDINRDGGVPKELREGVEKVGEANALVMILTPEAPERRAVRSDPRC